MNTQLDWNQLKAFWAVATHGSLSAAARFLDSSQPTVGRAISALEGTTKLTLFERLGKGLVLTESGRRLFQYAESMMDSAEDLALAMEGEQAEIGGDVTLSLSEADAFFTFPEVAKKLQVLAPQINLKVVVSNQFSDLKKREADIAIRYQRPEEDSLIAKKIGVETIHLYGQKEYVDSLNQKELDLSDRLKIISFQMKDQMKAFIHQQGWRVEDKHFGIECDNQMVQWQLARQGMGLMFLPEHIGDKEPELKAAYREKLEPMELDVWLVTHRELRTSKKIRVVYDFLSDQFAL